MVKIHTIPDGHVDMYAINTFLRLVRFITTSLVGLVVGFGLGVLYSNGRLADIVQSYF